MSKEAIDKYLQSVADDMKRQNAKTPSSAFRIESTAIEGSLIGPDWFQYFAFGRGPGKQPPPDKMLSWVQRNPEILASAKDRFKYITEKGLAFIIGRKIGREGTNTHKSGIPAVNVIESMERNMPELLQTLTRNEMLKIQTSLSKAIK